MGTDDANILRTKEIRLFGANELIFAAKKCPPNFISKGLGDPCSDHPRSKMPEIEKIPPILEIGRGEMRIGALEKFRRALIRRQLSRFSNSEVQLHAIELPLRAGAGIWDCICTSSFPPDDNRQRDTRGLDEFSTRDLDIYLSRSCV